MECSVARLERNRVKRPLRVRIAGSGDARGPSFPLGLYFLSCMQATPTQSGVFYAAPSSARSPVRSPSRSAPFPRDPPRRSFSPSPSFVRFILSSRPSSVVPSRFLTFLGPRILSAYATMCTCTHRVSRSPPSSRTTIPRCLPRDQGGPWVTWLKQRETPAIPRCVKCAVLFRWNESFVQILRFLSDLTRAISVSTL